MRNVQEYCMKTASNICFGYLLELPHRDDSNKYPKHVFYKEVRIKLFCFLHTRIILSIKDSLYIVTVSSF